MSVMGSASGKSLLRSVDSAVDRIFSDSPREQTEWLVEGDHDSAMDLTLSRLLAAEEFLDRLEETGANIGALAKSNRQKNEVRIAQMLGLQGHMQDELLRIYAMLTEGDQGLECLKPFEKSNERVVECMRDLARKEHNLETEEKQEESEARNDEVQEAFLEDNEPEDLQKKHNQEEEEVAKNYAHRIALGRASADEIQRLLADHLLSMQALRRRQQAEREKFEEKLAAKRDRRLSRQKSNELTPHRRPNGDIANKSASIVEEPKFKVHGEKSDKAGDDEMVKELFRKFKRKEIGVEDLNRLLREHLERTNQLQQLKNSQQRNWDDKLTEKLRRGKISHEFDDDDFDEDLDALKDKFTAALSAKGKNISEADAQRLLADYRAAQKRLLEQRAAEKDRLHDKLRRNHRLMRGFQEQDKKFAKTILTDRSHGHVSQEDFVNKLKSHLSQSEKERLKYATDDDKHNNLSTETQDEMAKLESSFCTKLARQFHRITEKELIDLLDQYRKDQRKALSQRLTENRAFDEKLDGKLRQRSRDEGDIPEVFVDELKRRMSLDEFSEDQVSQELQKTQTLQPGQGKRRKSSCINVENEANSLLQVHQQQAKHIQNMREQQKAMADEQLRKKLQHKKITK